jgi:hypothetical protein
MRSTMYGMLGVALLLTASNLQAQFVPLEAKIRETRVTTVDGKDVTKVKEGNYYRSSAGSVLIQWLTANGEKSWDGTLQDNVGLALYRLDYGAHHAYQERNYPKIAAKPGMYADAKAVGTDAVEGISCKIVSAKVVLPGGAGQHDAGGVCVSPQYDLRIYEDLNLGGEHTRTELYAIRLGVEPVPSLFDIKSKFTIYTVKVASPANSQQAQ